MADIRLIATDIDGTFLNGERKPSEKTLSAVCEVKKLGVRVCACSGRNITELRDLCIRAGLDDLAVMNNGACVANVRTEEIIHVRRIAPRDRAKQMLLALASDAKNYPHPTLSVAGSFDTHMWRGLCDESMLQRAKVQESESGFTGERYFVHDEFESFMEAATKDMQRILYNLDSVTHGRRIMDLLEPYGGVDITTAAMERMELTPKGISKGYGLMQLCAYYGIGFENLMAIGDGLNDESMLRLAGVSVAMGNAVQGLLDIASFVTDTNEQEGFYQALHHHVLHGM